jgi:hypothetical protein
MISNKHSISDNRSASTSKYMKIDNDIFSNEFNKCVSTQSSVNESIFLSDFAGFKNVSLRDMINWQTVKFYEKVHVR